MPLSFPYLFAISKATSMSVRIVFLQKANRFESLRRCQRLQLRPLSFIALRMSASILPGSIPIFYLLFLFLQGGLAPSGCLVESCLLSYFSFNSFSNPPDNRHSPRIAYRFVSRPVRALALRLASVGNARVVVGKALQALALNRGEPSYL